MCYCAQACIETYIIKGFILIGGDEDGDGNVGLKEKGTRVRDLRFVCGFGPMMERGEWCTHYTLISAVLALKSLQKSIIFKPAWPRAGPTGGDGFACPALMTSLIVDATALPDMVGSNY